jgi:hypothetical protein
MRNECTVVVAPQCAEGSPKDRRILRIWVLRCDMQIETCVTGLYFVHALENADIIDIF